MKKLLLITAGIFLIVAIVHAQTIHVANNNPGAATGLNVHVGATALQDAVNAAVAGDIIYVVPSSVIYAGITDINKGLTIFGIGFRADKDLGLKSQVNQLDINASDVRISGIVCTGTFFLGWALSGVTMSNLMIENCRVGRLRMNSGNSVTVSNMLVRNNIITASGSTFDTKDLEFYTTSNVAVTNNLIITTCCSNSGVRATGVTFTNNIFAYNGTTGNSGNTFTDVDACTFDYNIFYGSWQTLPAGSTNNKFNYNLSFGNSDNTFTQIGDADGNTGTGNVAGGDPMLVNFPLATANTWSDGFDLSLLTGSAADNIDGVAGTAGVTGGLTPWDREGTLLPTIQSVTLPSTIPVGTDLPVTIKAKGN
jgi:hypothetical protein